MKKGRLKHRREDTTEEGKPLAQKRRCQRRRQYSSNQERTPAKKALTLACLHELDVAFQDLPLQFYMKLTLRSLLFPFSSTKTCCYAPWSSLAALHNLMLRSISPLPCLWVWCYTLWPSLELLYWNWLLRPLIFSCQSSWTCAPWSALAVLNELDAMALVNDLHSAILHERVAALHNCDLRFHMNLLLRCVIFPCSSTWTWRYAPGFSLQFNMNSTQRSMILTCMSTWTWCCAACSSLAILHELGLDAALQDLRLHFYDPGLHPYTPRCYAMWSSLAFLHELDVALHDLHLSFYMNLVLRSMILIYMSIRLDATLCDLHLQHVSMNTTLRYRIFTRVAASTWCYAWISSLARYVNSMLRSMIFPCCSTLSVLHEMDATLFALPFQFYPHHACLHDSTWAWCCAPWSSLACLHELDAVLHDPRLRVHMTLTLRSMIFTRSST